MAMANQLFQEAKEAVSRITNAGGGVSENERQIARDVIQAAYQNASSEERQELQQLEQRLQQHGEL
ncbi:DUF3813 family protein [Bacillaceae bacterium S4-13-58]